MKTYIYANGQILCQHDGNDSTPLYFYLHDRLGSVRQVIDTSGVVKNSYTYNPFGEMFPTECSETVSNPFKFAGLYFDSETDEYYLRARMYDPLNGRFLQIDPIGYESGLNLYTYCGNNPFNLVDPMGLMSFMPHWNAYLRMIKEGAELWWAENVQPYLDSAESAAKVTTGVALDLGVGSAIDSALPMPGLGGVATMPGTTGP